MLASQTEMAHLSLTDLSLYLPSHRSARSASRYLYGAMEGNIPDRSPYFRDLTSINGFYTGARFLSVMIAAIVGPFIPSGGPERLSGSGLPTSCDFGPSAAR